MFRSEFFDRLKQYNAWILEDEAGQEVIIQSDLTVRTSAKDYKCKSIEEVCAVPTSSGKTIGELINNLQSLEFKHVPVSTGAKPTVGC